MLLSWIVIPVLGYGNDDTLDPMVFALFPIGRAQLMRGMLGAALVGFGPLYTLIVLLGAVVAFTNSLVAALAAFVLTALEIVLCITVSRALTSAIGALLNSRRGRDIGVIMSMLLVVGLQIANLRLQHNVSGSGFSSSGVTRMAHLLRWVPTAILGQGFAAIATHHWAQWALAVTINLVVIGAALLWWSIALARTTTRSPDKVATQPARQPSSLFRRLPFLPHNRMGAVAARELLGFRRDPRRAAMLIPAVAIPLVWAFSLQPSATALTGAAPAFALTGIVFTNRFSANIFGVDGNAFWPHVLVGNNPYPDICGKQLAIALIISPIVAVLAIALGVVAGAYETMFVAIALIPCVLGIHLGIGAVSSARFPQPLPERGNPFGTLNGQGCANGLSAIAMLAIELLIMLPIAIALVIGVRYSTASIPITIAISYAIAFAIWRTTTQRAGAYLAPRLPELLARIDPKQA